MGQIQRFEAVFAQGLSDFDAFTFDSGGQADKHVRFVGIADAVDEFGDIAL